VAGDSNDFCTLLFRQAVVDKKVDAAAISKLPRAFVWLDIPKLLERDGYLNDVFCSYTNGFALQFGILSSS
jgi:hypothetical protein